jgi:hypothetical protein
MSRVVWWRGPDAFVYCDAHGVVALSDVGDRRRSLDAVLHGVADADQ